MSSIKCVIRPFNKIHRLRITSFKVPSNRLFDKQCLYGHVQKSPSKALWVIAWNHPQSLKIQSLNNIIDDSSSKVSNVNIGPSIITKHSQH